MTCMYNVFDNEDGFHKFTLNCPHWQGNITVVIMGSAVIHKRKAYHNPPDGSTCDTVRTNLKEADVLSLKFIDKK